MVRRTILTAAAALLLSSNGRAQDEPNPGAEAGASPGFVVEALTFASGDLSKTRIDVFIQVEFESLSFVKENDSYRASYEVTATLFDSTKTVVDEQSWTENISGLAFDATVSAGAAKISQRSFTVAPGKYDLSIQMSDNDTKKTRRLQRNFLVPTYVRPGLCMSSIMLLSRFTEQGGIKKIVPSVSANMGLVPDRFHFFCEVYNRSRADSVRFTVSILDQKNQVVLKTDTVEEIEPGRHELFMSVPHGTLPVGDYKLALVASDESNAQILSEVARAFVIRWRGMPLSVNSLDLAIDQVRYIAREAEYDSLKSATTTEEKQRLFLAFWKRRDPNPNTPRNERMEDFYARVDYANKHFSHYRQGWKTDMGMVFIILGPPNNVERHPFDMDSKPYEVWAYYDINQSFVFVDDSGFGDFRLITPISELYRYAR